MTEDALALAIGQKEGNDQMTTTEPPRPPKQRRIDFQPVETGTVAQQQKRLSGQNMEILARLQRGRATNQELSRLALKYSGRISDLRRAGIDIRLMEHDRRTGVATYALFRDGLEVNGCA